VLALMLALLGLAPSAALAKGSTGVYTNPLTIQIPGDGLVESCADPSVIRGQTPGDTYWYMYCTSDPLSDTDRNANGDFIFHRIPMFKSSDLVHWVYQGDAAGAFPSWAFETAALWAPEISYFNGKYYLYYVVTDVKDEVSGALLKDQQDNIINCGGDSAIGVATSASPLGPWVPQAAPVVEPRYNGNPTLPFGQRECNFFWTFDPDVITANNQRYIYYGSYYGGIQARNLSNNGFTADPVTAVQITIPNRYEGAEVIQHDGYYYLFVSATNCCNGPLTAYSVFAGRSDNPLGPFVDREGVSLLAGRVGGTPVISMNGNRWVGTGHNTVFQDFEGQYWTIYHAVDQNDPYFEGAVGFTKRPVLLDPLDWVDGWPTVRGGLWASDNPVHAPAAQPGDKGQYKPKLVKDDELGSLRAAFSEEFNSATLSPKWSWVRQPDAATFGLENGAFRFDTQAADLFVDSNSASVLTEAAPHGNYVVETRVHLNLPAEGCCYNYVQAGLVIYGDDDNFIKLAHVSIWETRQTEFAKELKPVPDGYPRYGNTVVGPPSEWTYLRIVKREHAGQEEYTAYTSQDGQHWVRGGVWTHKLGNDARIGLVSMGGSGFVANFDYVRVYKLK